LLEQGAVPIEHESLCSQVVQFILSRDRQELATLDEKKIAGIFGVKRSRLSREFKAAQKVDLDRFILKERLHRAFFMIEEDREVSGRELSVQLGFAQFKSFCREFKNLFLIDPDRYIHLRRESKSSPALGTNHPCRSLSLA
jgi:AraC-like DNA-binding protein